MATLIRDAAAKVISDIRSLLVKAIITGLFLYVINLVLPDDFWRRKMTINTVLSYSDLLVIGGLLLAAIVTLITFSTWKLRKLRVFDGREASMAANCHLIEKFCTDKTVEIRSTRVTHWRIADNSAGRQKFRNLLTEKITNSIPVKRIWQLKDLNDFTQLQRYVEQYAQYDNYSVKVIVSRNVVIPEILVVGQKVASLSLPEPSSPRELGRALHFYGHREVVALTRYFDILWETAVPIKSASEQYDNNLNQIRDYLRHAANEPLPSLP